MSWRLVYTKQAQKDAEKLASSGLKPKAQELLDILAEDPFQKPPPFEKLVGGSFGCVFAKDQHSTLVGVSGVGRGSNRRSFVSVESLRIESVLQNRLAKAEAMRIPDTDTLAAQSREELLRRNGIFAEFFRREAPRLAGALQISSDRLRRGERLLF